MRSHMPLCTLNPQTHALQESSMRQTFAMLPCANVIQQTLLLSSGHRCHHPLATIHQQLLLLPASISHMSSPSHHSFVDTPHATATTIFQQQQLLPSHWGNCSLVLVVVTIIHQRPSLSVAPTKVFMCFTPHPAQSILYPFRLFMVMVFHEFTFQTQLFFKLPRQV